MLSDASIKRDDNPILLRRILLKLREIFSKEKRQLLNKKIHAQLEGVSFSIFCNNCLAGVFYHDAGLEFTTPTVNLAFDGEDFIRFLERPKYYLNHEMKFISVEGIHNYPIAHIDDIEVRFVHYNTQEEAEQAWKRRTERINWSSLFIIATNHDGMGRDDLMERFDKLPYKNKVMFVSHEYPQYDWAVLVPQFKGRFQVKIMTSFANFMGERYYETCFDIPNWICKNKMDTKIND